MHKSPSYSLIAFTIHATIVEISKANNLKLDLRLFHRNEASIHTGITLHLDKLLVDAIACR